jgi:hypothetical protein
MATALAVQAETGSVNGRSNLTRALQGAWLPLESGLAVSAREGTPLSAKYEIDDGAFQLSVYTSKAGPLRRTPSWKSSSTTAPVWC